MDGTIEKFYATGKRKESIAKVWIQKGSGKISVNNKSIKEYFCRESLECIIKHPLITTDTLDSIDIQATVLLALQGGADVRPDLHSSFRRPLENRQLNSD